MTSNLLVVLDYCGWGFSVIPVQPRDKRPLVAWEEYQERRATEEEIRGWWGRWRDANVGIVTGEISGLVVVDLDSPEAKQKLKELCQNCDLTAIPRSRTGQGWHLFFKHPGLSIPNRAGILPGVDIRGDGGFVVAPPSVHPSGKAYRWEVPVGERLPELPPELLNLMLQPRETATTQPEKERIREGQRNATLTSLAGTMRRPGMSEEAILAALLEENRKRCDPPLPEREVVAIADSVSRYESKPKADGKTERYPVMVRLSEVEREEVTWLWQSRIPKGKLTLFDGDPGVGKSWLTLAVAAAVTLGRALPGDVDREPDKVLIMTAEDGLGDTVRPRLEDMGATLDLVVALKGLRDEKGQERSLTLADLDVLEAAIKEHSPGLVIVDPVVAYVGKCDTHKAGEVRGLLAPLAALAEKYRCAVVGVRHLNKSSMKAIYRGQSSIDFLATCRSALLIGENPDNPSERVICHLKSNLAPKMPSLTFSIEQDRFFWGGVSTLNAEQVLAVPAQGEAKTELEEAKEFLKQVLCDGQVSASEVKTQARGIGISEATLRRAKAALGVRARKGGFQAGWQWELPRCSSSAEDAHINTVSTFDKNEHLRNVKDVLEAPDPWEVGP